MLWNGVLWGLASCATFAAFTAFPAFAQNAPEAQLAQLINARRMAQGQPALSLSPALMGVAQAHVDDLEAHTPVGACNAHSWSPHGPWTPCCYTADHAQAACMWDKPKELSRGAYPSPGFEIVFWASKTATPEFAVQRWLASAGHADVMLNQGAWRNTRWRAMGVALSTHYAVAWFGEAP